MATTTLVTVHEFLQMPEEEGLRRELIGGEVVTMPRAGYPHEVTKANLTKALILWSIQTEFRVFIETTFQLDEQNCVIADVSLISSARVVAGTTGIFQSAPEVSMEVVSSETAARLEEKIELYLAHGSKSVWAVFPEQRVVRIFDSSGQSKKFEQSQTLEDPALPGFSAPVSAIFEGV